MNQPHYRHTCIRPDSLQKKKISIKVSFVLSKIHLFSIAARKRIPLSKHYYIFRFTRFFFVSPPLSDPEKKTKQKNNGIHGCPRKLGSKVSKDQWVK